MLGFSVRDARLKAAAPFDPALRDLRLNRAAGRVTKTATASEICCQALTVRLLVHRHKIIPAIMEAAAAVCALDIPRKERGLMRMNSTRKRATPVSTR